MTSIIAKETLARTIAEAEEALERKVGLGRIRQIDCNCLSALIAVALTLQRPSNADEMRGHVAGLIAEEDGGDFYDPASAHFDGAERVIAYFAERWYPMDQPPEVERGQDARFLVAWRNKSNRKQYSGEIYYLNAVTLDWDDETAPSEATGWFERYEGRDGDVTFEPISDQFVEHLGWTHLPMMPEVRS